MTPEQTRELVENLRRYSKGKGLTPREAEQAADAIEALEEMLKDAIDCVDTLVNDYRMHPDSRELIHRLTHKARAALAPAKEVGDDGPKLVCVGCGTETTLFKPICDTCMSLAGIPRSTL